MKKKFLCQPEEKEQPVVKRSIPHQDVFKLLPVPPFFIPVAVTSIHRKFYVF